MRFSEKEGKEMVRFALGYTVVFKQSKAKKQPKPQINPKMETIHGKARHYRVISGKVVEYSLKEGESV